MIAQTAWLLPGSSHWKIVLQSWFKKSSWNMPQDIWDSRSFVNFWTPGQFFPLWSVCAAGCTFKFAGFILGLRVLQVSFPSRIQSHPEIADLKSLLRVNHLEPTIHITVQTWTDIYMTQLYAWHERKIWWIANYWNEPGCKRTNGSVSKGSA